MLGSWVRLPPPPPNKENTQLCSPARNVARYVRQMTFMRLINLPRNFLHSAAKGARIIGEQEYLQGMILIAPVRSARGRLSRVNQLLNSGTTQNLIISVVSCAEISGY